MALFVQGFEAVTKSIFTLMASDDTNGLTFGDASYA
jgi:hypothetical protein